MDQFCREIIKFIETEYGDGYAFKLESVVSAKHLNGTVELRIKISPKYIKIINCDCMNYIFYLYRTGEFAEERGQFKWQKELVDMIEGG